MAEKITWLREYSLSGPAGFDLGHDEQNSSNPEIDSSWESYRQDNIEFPSNFQDISTLTALGDSRPDITLTPLQNDEHPRLYTSASLPQRPPRGWLLDALEPGDDGSSSDPDRPDDFALDTLSEGGVRRTAARKLFPGQPSMRSRKTQGHASSRSQSQGRARKGARTAPGKASKSDKEADPLPKRRRPKRRSAARARETAERLNEWWMQKKAEHEEFGRRLRLEEAADLLRERAAIMAATRRGNGGQNHRRSNPEDTVARLLAWDAYRQERLREKAAEWEAQERVKPPKPPGVDGAYQVVRRYPTNGPDGEDAMDFLVMKLHAWGKEKKEERERLVAAIREEEREAESANLRRPMINPVSQAMRRGPALLLHWEQQRREHIKKMREEVAARELRDVRPGPAIDPVSAEMAASMPRPKKIEDRLLRSGEERRKQIAAMARAAEKERSALARGAVWRQQQKQKHRGQQQQEGKQWQRQGHRKQAGQPPAQGHERPGTRGTGEHAIDGGDVDDSSASAGGDDDRYRRGAGSDEEADSPRDSPVDEGGEGKHGPLLDKGGRDTREGRLRRGRHGGREKGGHLSGEGYRVQGEEYPEDGRRIGDRGRDAWGGEGSSGSREDASGSEEDGSRVPAGNHKPVGSKHHIKKPAGVDTRAMVQAPPAAPPATLRSSRGSNDPVEGAGIGSGDWVARRDVGAGPGTPRTVPDDSAARLFGTAVVYEGKRRVRQLAQAVAGTRDKATGAPLFRPAINPVSRRMKRGVPIEDRLLEHGLRRQQKLELLARRNEVAASVAHSTVHRYAAQVTSSSSSAPIAQGRRQGAKAQLPSSAAPISGGQHTMALGRGAADGKVAQAAGMADRIGHDGWRPTSAGSGAGQPAQQSAPTGFMRISNCLTNPSQACHIPEHSQQHHRRPEGRSSNREPAGALNFDAMLPQHSGPNSTPFLPGQGTGVIRNSAAILGTQGALALPEATSLVCSGEGCAGYGHVCAEAQRGSDNAGNSRGPGWGMGPAGHGTAGAAVEYEPAVTAARSSHGVVMEDPASVQHWFAGLGPQPSTLCTQQVMSSADVMASIYETCNFLKRPNTGTS